MNKTFVLDANALLNLLSDSPGATRVERLIREADQQKHSLAISVANWGEVFYITWLRRGDETAKRTMDGLQRLPVQVVPLDLAQTLKAAEIKALHSIPYVDCMAAALASLRGATLVTSDRHFERLGRRFPILWIQR
jgi:predicted nucleic acid-binding protein